ncbi:MAG: hypothetical protein QOJ07_487 [Thermoleophilaceae bacterium]|nr:hypothetical protein [Thermoleophilaceae bacterium]
MHNDHAATTPAVDELVDAILQSHGQLTLIVEHMLRYPGTALDAPPLDAVLRGLLGDVLAQLPERHGAEDVATAAQMLRAATELIGEELYLVDMNRRERRAAGRRRGEH